MPFFSFFPLVRTAGQNFTVCYNAQATPDQEPVTDKANSKCIHQFRKKPRCRNFSLRDIGQPGLVSGFFGYWLNFPLSCRSDLVRVSDTSATCSPKSGGKSAGSIWSSVSRSWIQQNGKSCSKKLFSLTGSV